MIFTEIKVTLIKEVKYRTQSNCEEHHAKRIENGIKCWEMNYCRCEYEEAMVKLGILMTVGLFIVTYTEIQRYLENYRRM